jgi:hypothetical protein
MQYSLRAEGTNCIWLILGWTISTRGIWGILLQSYMHLDSRNL